MGYEGGTFGFNLNSAFNASGTATWASLYGGANADGSIHCYDFYAVPYAAFTGFSGFEWGENQSSVNTVTGLPPSYTDFDLMRIDNNATPGSRMGCS